MRWSKPKCGDTRVVGGFLWLPMTLNDETRWLERATWREVYDPKFLERDWLPFKWLDEEVKP